MSNGWVGVSLLLALILGAIPWYRGWKEERLWRSAGDDTTEHVAEARFESWLGMQRAPVTAVLIALTVLVGLLQVVLPGEGWELAGLVKDAVRGGERWRLLTAPWLHGHPVHWFVNAGALAYLGKRCEALARWPHLLSVFLIAAWLGGEASVWLVSKASVGASGGLLGLLGFLLVFETLHRKLVPVSARRRLLAGVLVTGLLGLVGFQFIDNAAHAGGLVAGMVYAGVVFPPSVSPLRPRALRRDRVVGSLAGVVLVGSALLAAWKVVAG
jgi:membrane associated rhomboid family serine protease